MFNKKIKLNNYNWPYILIIVNIIIFIFQMIFPNITTNFALSKDFIHRPWILLTHMFLHYNFNHLFFNMFALMMFGPLLESKIGSKRFLIVYFTSGLIAGIVGGFVYDSAIGASAAIMGILGATIYLIPDLPVLFFFVIPMRLRTAGIIWFLMDFLGLFSETSIGNLAHIVGMSIGLLFGKYYKNKINIRNPFIIIRNQKDNRTNNNKKDDFYNKKIITIDDIEEIL